MKYQKAFKLLRDEKVVVFPTDTVSGIGCSIKSEGAIKRVYEIKKRPFNKPTAVLVSDLEMVKNTISQKLDSRLKKLLYKHWPGGLTVVLKARKSVPGIITNQSHEVGIRIPDHDKLRDLIDKLACPIVATSANFAGEKTPIKYNEISKKLLGLVDYAINEDSFGQQASTVVRYEQNGKLSIIREGAVSLD